MRRRILETDCIYHVCNRGVDKRKIFLDEKDRLRFVHDLFEFNDQTACGSVTYSFLKHPLRTSGLDDKPFWGSNGTKEPVVKIFSFSVMPNHFHLLIQQLKENGIVRFMQKLEGGYALYFNHKYQRKGALFEGRFKAIPITKQSHLLHIPFYIHANPLSLKGNESEDDMKFLNSYRWSSHLDYCGWNNFPCVTERNFLLEFFDGESNYRKAMISWIKERSKNLKKIREIALEDIP